MLVTMPVSQVPSFDNRLQLLAQAFSWEEAMVMAPVTGLTPLM